MRDIARSPQSEGSQQGLRLDFIGLGGADQPAQSCGKRRGDAKAQQVRAAYLVSSCG